MGKACAPPRTKDGKKLNCIKEKLRQKIVADKSVAKILEEIGFCPFDHLARLAKQARSEYVSMQAGAELAKYVRPQLKSIEVKGSDTDPLTFIINI